MNFIGYLLRYDEIALKGKNRPFFEKRLVQNLKIQLRDESVKIKRLWGRILIESPEPAQIEPKLAEVFGIATFSPVFRVSSVLEDISTSAVHIMRKATGSFRVVTKRVDKTFLPKSPDVNRHVAEAIFQEFPHLMVNLKKPDHEVGIEIREDETFLYSKKVEGLRGLPVGVSGRALTLLSGGIDSPVAAWLMMKRGSPVDFIHFYSYPYTGIQSKQKVIDMAKRLTVFQNRSRLFVIPFTAIQEVIQKKCHERFRTLLYRRFMQRISTKVAEEMGAVALVTGESLGQVASQTLENISAISQSTPILVIRPLISFNKQETVQLAKKIGTFSISIQPFDDCCTLFQPKEPATKSKLHQLIREEESLECDSLVLNAVSQMEILSL